MRSKGLGSSNRRSRSCKAKASTTYSVDHPHRQRLSSSTSKPETHSYHSATPSFHSPQLSRGSTTSTSEAPGSTTPSIALAANFRAGTYPKYNGSTEPAQYIMSYQVVIASSGGDDATMAKSFIITLEGPALTWYTRLPPLSIDSWKGLRDKFLLNFQGYRPDTDALAELSLCKQQEKETLHGYYRKFLTLKSQLPSVDDHIAIHYAISGLRASIMYSHCIRDPPKNLQELYQLFEKYARSEELH
jgi:hypothetical protein